VLGKLALFQGGRQKVELSKEVKAEAEKAVALDPNEDLAYHVLGVWNREMVELNWMLKKFAEVLYGRFPPASMDEALRDLRKASALAPNVVPHQVELGVTLAAARQWEEAKTTLDHALAMPKSWVTDDVYKEQAKQTRARVAAHLK
jgi:tetratricopeptide (TPR) repeat protein